jgi:hypothetical protein
MDQNPRRRPTPCGRGQDLDEALRCYLFSRELPSPWDWVAGPAHSIWHPCAGTEIDRQRLLVRR